MYLKVLIQPSARREEVTSRPAKGGAGEELSIAVREPAEGNRANTRVREIVAKRYGMLTKQVRIVSGHHSRSKMLSIPD